MFSPELEPPLFESQQLIVFEYNIPVHDSLNIVYRRRKTDTHNALKRFSIFQLHEAIKALNKFGIAVISSD